MSKGLLWCALWAGGAMVSAAVLATPIAQDSLRTLEGWRALASDQVQATLRPASPKGGLCLDYDFRGVSGYAVARREWPIQWPSHPEVQMRVKTVGGPNTVQIKWVDASGDNVWWFNRSNVPAQARWQTWRIPARRIEFAWGPASDKRLRNTAAMEIVAVAGQAGGKGAVCVEDIRLSDTPAPPAQWPDPAPQPLRQGWQWALSAAAAGPPREFSGLALRWPDGAARAAYTVEASDDGQHWTALGSVGPQPSRLDTLWTPEARARWLRARWPGAAKPAAPPQLTVVPISGPAAWQHLDDAFKAQAAVAQRGAWPRAYMGEQNFWTVVGVDGGARQSALMSEDGALELGVAAPSVEPAVRLKWQDGRETLHTWADVRITQQLPQSGLPLPQVHWEHAAFTLDIQAAAQGAANSAQAFARYHLQPRDPALASAQLLLLLRPLQVNPPQQFLNTPGGWAAVRHIQAVDQGWRVNQRWQLSLWPRPERAQVGLAPAGPLWAWPQAPALNARPAWQDPEGLSQALWTFAASPQPQTIDLSWGLAATVRPRLQGPEATTQALAAVAQGWQQRLGQLQLDIPAADPRLLASLRSALAHILISRQGPALQPGTRAYARTWIRDGAMMVSGLVRLGEHQAAREFVDWFSTQLFANGKVPCCWDHRGSDPVVENDSHGQYIFAVAELWRHRRPGDGITTDWLRQHWPAVLRAARYMDQLRAQQEQAFAHSQGLAQAYRGVMPKSISHEGYSAQPMHSYWDNFWALKGYKDAVFLAQAMGDAMATASLQQSLQAFGQDLAASVQRARTHHGVDFVPGAADLGDFDATSTTVALDPAQAQHLLPPGSLDATFERYWQEAQQRAKGQRDWKDYTPYELRTVGALIRLGQRQRAWAMLDFFFADQRPTGWLQWAEVVMREPRQTHFLGDMPHAWVSSDYVRAALDIFWHERERADGKIDAVLGAGWPAAWWRDGRLRLAGLQTRWGALGLTLEPVPEGFSRWTWCCCKTWACRPMEQRASTSITSASIWTTPPWPTTNGARYW
ncbi:MAG: coagulation factor 5/8 type domain-containing protein [Ideonella sp. MAG2]|nr:MAG: coagulation factor 5/8 type domain-containing protein [Ideonella sp. MAG2]